MVSTELASRVLLTVFIVGAFSVCQGADDNSDSLKGSEKIKADEQQSSSSSLDSPLTPSGIITARSFPLDGAQDAETKLLPDSAEAGILLPFEDDFHQFPEVARRISADDSRRRGVNGEQSSSSLSFTPKPISLRISTGKSLPFPRQDGSKALEEEKSTYFLRNNCYGPRCPKSNQKDRKRQYYNSKEISGKKYDDPNFGPARRLDVNDNVMESMSSNFHSQLAIPFVVVDDSRSGLSGGGSQVFSKRNGVTDRYTKLSSSSTSTNVPGWVKLRPLSPDAYDPFHFARNLSTRHHGAAQQSTFSKRDSSNVASFSKRVGVELNPDSFADRWGWSANNDHDHRRGSPLPQWLEDQLKYGTRNPDSGKNWVKLDPIPVAGVTISKWVPKGTHSSDLPTTTWQNNRDRPNGGSPWWDRIDEHRILTGHGHRNSFLRPEVEDSYSPPPQYGNGWGGSKGGSSLSSLDRYPTNSWNDIVYPEGPVSATVSWQQNKGISSYPSSFSTGGGGSGGWPSSSENRKPIVATGAWSAPPHRRLPNFINRFGDNHPSSYPAKQANEDDPRWILISNSRRVTNSKGQEDRNDERAHKIVSYLNRLHPDIGRNEFPFHEDTSSSPHRHGKDLLWPFEHGSPSVSESPSRDEAFARTNATLSTLTPVLIHRGGTTVRPPVVNTIRPSDLSGSSDSSSQTFISSSSSSSSTLAPILSDYLGDGRGTSSQALQQSSTTTPLRSNLSGRIRQGLRNINPVYAAVGAGMIPATLAAVMPMVLGRRKRRDTPLTNIVIPPPPSTAYSRKLILRRGPHLPSS